MKFQVQAQQVLFSGVDTFEKSSNFVSNSFVKQSCHRGNRVLMYLLLSDNLILLRFKIRKYTDSNLCTPESDGLICCHEKGYQRILVQLRTQQRPTLSQLQRTLSLLLQSLREVVLCNTLRNGSKGARKRNEQDLFS
jgi:hypothetical protein